MCGEAYTHIQTHGVSSVFSELPDIIIIRRRSSSSSRMHYVVVLRIDHSNGKIEGNTPYMALNSSAFPDGS